MYEVVSDLLHPVTVLTAYQIRRRVLFVAVYEYDRPSYSVGQVHRKGCLTRAGRAAEVIGKAVSHISERAQ